MIMKRNIINRAILFLVLVFLAPVFARPELIQILPIPNQTIYAGHTFSYDVNYTVGDPPCFGRFLDFALTVKPAGMTINASTGLISWTPSANDTGTHTVTVRARAWNDCDESVDMDTDNFTIQVNPVNLVAPSNLEAFASGQGIDLYWDDNTLGEDGYVIERRISASLLYRDPAPVYAIGVAAPYLGGWAVTLLNNSAARFCQEEGFGTYKTYDTYGPQGGVHTWWTGSAWSTSGNNSVFYMENLTCRDTAWQQIAVVGEGHQYIHYLDSDLTSDYLGFYFEYRVRAFAAGAYSGWSNVAEALFDIVVGIGDDN